MLRTHTQIAQGLTLLLALLGAICAYWPALGGGLQFDDKINLNGLASVTNPNSAIEFILSGHAGPLGRPLALASFSLQAYAWPDHPEILLQTNILIHALNGALLAWCLLLLGRLRGISAAENNWTAISSTALWLATPLLASSSLFIVQRMATLSALFMLAGLAGYLMARSRLDISPKRALAGMSISLGLGTLLAVLSKESGALLPALLLVVECTLLRARLFHASMATRVWAMLFLALPIAMLIGYMGTQLPYSEHIALRREFNAEQRLWSQAVTLWQYLLHAFFPTPAQLTPFHDHLRVIPSLFQPAPLLAIGAWLLISGIAIQIRKRHPLLAFATFWYLAGHLLESSFIGLELYFAHRNYIPLIGPAYALASSLMAIKSPWYKSARIAITFYILTLYASLYNVTTLWGQPALAAEIWAIHQPDSIRANQNLAAQLHQGRWHSAALKILDSTYNLAPERRGGIGIQALTLSCAMHPDQDHSGRLEKLMADAEITSFEADLPIKLLDLLHQQLKESCLGVSLEKIERLGLKTAKNPAYASSPQAKHNLYSVLTELAIAQRDFGKTMTYIEISQRTLPSLEGLHLALKVLIDAGREDLGQPFIDITRQYMPRNPIQRLRWEHQLASLEKQLTAINNAPLPHYTQDLK